MKYGLEELDFAYDTYVNVSSLLPHRRKMSKKLVSRTRSEPVYRATDINDVDFGLENCQSSCLSSQLKTRRLSPVCQSPDDEEVSGLEAIHKESTNTADIDGAMYAVVTRHSKRLLAHRRYLSLSQIDFLAASINTANLPKKSSEQIIPSKSKIGTTTRVAITKQPCLDTQIITEQPCSSLSSTVNQSYGDCSIQSDKCYRCMAGCREAIRCCTCMWCVDAGCYHCFKDDIGYSSWTEDMISCQGSRVVVKNCKRWSLLCLATMIFPCVLFYPVLGGSLSLCMKQRAKKRKDSRLNR